MKHLFIIAFIVVALVQWFIPLNMIRRQEAVIEKGKAFKFLTQPVDPIDPLRGRYIFLSFKADNIVLPGRSFERGQQVYATVGNGADGYAVLTGLSEEPPATGNDYLKVNIRYSTYNDSVVYVTLPFEEFYMDESKAPRAETLYRASSTLENKTTYALVKIYRGEAVIRDVYVDNKPIATYLR
ncbi:MAG TPA: GDYXXLXY domain-containing protein [Chitinophagaceae bacterium]|nr:GDYXXLXY domain-containing protein [Chitinophagaceae bacterium]